MWCRIQVLVDIRLHQVMWALKTCYTSYSYSFFLLTYELMNTGYTINGVIICKIYVARILKPQICIITITFKCYMHFTTFNSVLSTFRSL